MNYKTYPLSVSMTPAFFDENHMLLKAQLNCLSNQTVQEFDVYLIDPHFQKRKDVIKEFSSKFKLDIKHIPYSPNVNIAKLHDCSIFNAGYCYSQSPINVRYSCYRFAKPTFIETILNAPKNINIDFYYQRIKPENDKFWNFENDKVDWNELVEEPFLESDTDIIDIPTNLYGNIAWNRDQWISINGTNEVITNFAHWEDIDFDTRANLANQKVIRKKDLLYRVYHTYGSFSQRSNVQVDVPCKNLCNKCNNVRHNHNDGDYETKLFDRIRNNDYFMYYDDYIWICKDCKLSGPVYNGKKSIDFYLSYIRSKKLIKAPIIKEHLIGRNLEILCESMDKQTTLEGKIKIYNESWNNAYYY